MTKAALASLVGRGRDAGGGPRPGRPRAAGGGGGRDAQLHGPRPAAARSRDRRRAAEQRRPSRIPCSSPAARWRRSRCRRCRWARGLPARYERLRGAAAPRGHPPFLLRRPVRGRGLARTSLRVRAHPRGAPRRRGTGRPTRSWRPCWPTGAGTCGSARLLDDTTVAGAQAPRRGGSRRVSPPPVEGKVLALRVGGGPGGLRPGRGAGAGAPARVAGGGEPAEREHFVREFRRIAGLSGFRLPPGQEPAVNLAAARRIWRKPTGAWARRLPWVGNRPHRPVRAASANPSAGRACPRARSCTVDFSLDGYARSITWEHLSAPLFQAGDLKRLRGDGRRVRPPAPGAGRVLRASLRGHLASASTWQVRNVSGSRPGRVRPAPASPLPRRRSPRRAARPHRRSGRAGRTTTCGASLLSGLIVVPIAIAVAGLFFALLLRARIDLVNGALLSLIALLSASPRWLFKYLSASPWLTAMGWLFQAPGAALAIFLAWSAGESLLRSARPDFTTSLDTLRRGRLGPRGGRALLAGFAWGAGLAGLRLALYALAVPVPGLSPAGPSLDVPPFRIQGSPVSERHLPRRRRGPRPRPRPAPAAAALGAVGGGAPGGLRPRRPWTSCPGRPSWRSTWGSPACWSGSAAARA